MPERQLESVMRDFVAQRHNVLLCSTIIETGIDVPSANTIVISRADKFGLAQLHQLRGRVGRGSVESSCVLLYQSPLSPLARERLAVLRDTTDGFEVARRDLELRGPGELLGTRQTGLMQLKVADLVRDSDLLPAVQKAAALMLEGPGANIVALLRRWVGEGERFGKV
jgi:ATP-dependent DNA helicase RecG